MKSYGTRPLLLLTALCLLWAGGANAFEPTRRADGVEFRYRDRDFGQVSIAGEFNGWTRVPMHLDGDSGDWLISLDLAPGTHGYHFIVDEEGATWTALDPGNAETKRDDAHGWVSQITVGADGDVVAAEKLRDEDGRSRDSRRRWGADWRDGGRERRRDDDWDEDWKDGWEDWDDDRDIEWHSGLHGECGGDGFPYDDEDEISYQRVDGLSIGFSPNFDSHRDYEPSIHTRFSYGWKSEKWSYGGSLLQPLSPDQALQLKIAGYAMTDHNDQTGIGSTENSLAALLFKEDFRDYFRREGVTVAAVYDNFGWLAAEGGVRADNYESLENHADWSFADGEFRANPAIDEGTMRSLFGRVRLGTQLNHIDLQYEKSGEDLLEGDYEFEQLTGQIRARLNLGYNPYIDFRLKVGKNFAGALPVQKRYFAGGLGTVRGYPFQSLLETGEPPVSRSASQVFGGEQMLVANVEYVFDFFGSLQGLLSFDAGMVWSDRSASMDLGDLKSSAGAGIQFEDGGMRLHLAQRLDEGDHDPVVELRLFDRMF